jgi:ERCC4-related helicase
LISQTRTKKALKTFFEELRASPSFPGSIGSKASRLINTFPALILQMKPRPYQTNAANAILSKGNSLLVMPTAMGKTFIAVLVAREKLRNGKILFLAPTKPLAIQQARAIQELLGEPTTVLTGETPPAKRVQLYSSARSFCGTPQCIENDLLSRRIDLNDFSLIVFDEAHRAVGNYSYAFIGRQAAKSRALVLGLTASPSADKEKTRAICSALGITHLEVRRRGDEDVKEFDKPVQVERAFVDLPESFKDLRSGLRELLSESLSFLKQEGFLQSADVSKAHKRVLLAARPAILAKTPHPSAYKALSELARAMNLVHAIDLLEAQGAAALRAYLSGMQNRKQKSKAVQRLLADARIGKIVSACDSLIAVGLEHPKMKKLKETAAFEASRGNSLMVFAHYRNSVNQIIRELNSLAGVNARALVGRSKDGMTQKQQAEVLDAFRAKEFNALVATRVGEEGLDVPAVDLVVFYEAVPSEIRLIQRRGRAGRVRAGRALIMITRDSKDEGFYWIARRKESRMHAQIEELKRELENKGQKNLRQY